MGTTEFSPKAVRLSRKEIHDVAEEFGKIVGYTPSVNLRSVVEKLGGNIVDQTIGDELVAEASYIEVTPNQNPLFTIHMTAMPLAPSERYTIAHELGHLVLHSQFGRQAIVAKNDFRTASEPAERQAHEFAMAFLVPKNEVEKLIDEIGAYPLGLAARFDVSVEVAVARLQSLGYF